MKLKLFVVSVYFILSENCLIAQITGLETPLRAEHKSTYVPQHVDRTELYNILERKIERKQREYDLAKEREEREDELERQKEEYEEKLKLEKTKSRISSFLSVFNNSNKPSKLTDGWYNVFSTDMVDFGDYRKVYVENNKITKYIIDNWEKRKVLSSSTLASGKCIIQTQNGNKTYDLNIYFLDLIKTTPPVGSGSITFYTTCNNLEFKLKIYLDGEKQGIIDTYFDNKPNCNEDGTLSIDTKIGKYRYFAKSGDIQWSGTVEVEDGFCHTIGLNCD